MRNAIALSIFFAALLVGLSCDLGSTDYYQPDFAPRVRIVAQGAGPEYGPELLPLDPANRWLFQREIAVSAGGDISGIEYIQMTPVAQQQIYRDTAWRVLMQTTATAHASYIKVDKTGIWYYGTQLETIPTPIPWVLFPARVGMRWEIQTGKDDNPIEGEILSREYVACPAGVFEALSVSVGTERLWLVPNLGLVKRISMYSLDYGWYLLRSYQVPGFVAPSLPEVQP